MRCLFFTSEFGAEDQFWHQDTLPQGSSFKHARTFVPSYSLFVPLQDTTPEIGAFVLVLTCAMDENDFASSMAFPLPEKMVCGPNRRVHSSTNTCTIEAWHTRTPMDWIEYYSF